VRVSGRVRRACEETVWAAGRSTLPGRNAYHQLATKEGQRERGDLGLYEFDFHEGFVAVVEEVACLAGVNAHDTEQELAAETQRKGHFVLFDDGLRGAHDACLQQLRLGQLALVRCQPHLGQRALPQLAQFAKSRAWGVCTFLERIASE
jgi:hypothetical protein